jgi:murein L,D-transpeptidase YcbB/YkuD
MRLTRHFVAATLVLTAALVACDREPRGEPSPHITDVLSQAEAPVLLQLPGGDTLNLSAPVVAFYRQRGYRQAWTDYDEILDRGWTLLRAMEASSADGLDPAQYRYDVAHRLVQEVEGDSIAETAEPAQMAIADMVLSEVFGRYANHVAGGIIDPTGSGIEWRIPKDTVDVGALLTRLADDEDPAAIVASLRPGAPQYALLMDALARYTEILAQGGWQEVPSDVQDEIGERGPAVAVLRQRLIAEADAEEARLATAGNAQPDVFDESLKQALEHFQERHSIDADGAVGPATLEQLNTSAEQRVQQLRLNLDQWRWLPDDLGDRYILVNVAGFEMELVENDSVLIAMDVVVGQEGWETPIFQDTLESIVVNPYWNVPSGIMADEVLPAIQRDPDYLARNNMEVLRGDRVVDASSIDWSQVSGNTNYRVRQKQGPDNALGQVKFLFPNENDIYLHDTPARAPFNASNRAFSHGCIRLERPLELARILLDRTTETPSSRLDDLLARDGEQWIRVTEPVPVYILYFTAWAADDGSVRFHPDVYERDERLNERAAAALRAD